MDERRELGNRANDGLIYSPGRWERDEVPAWEYWLPESMSPGIRCDPAGLTLVSAFCFERIALSIYHTVLARRSKVLR